MFKTVGVPVSADLPEINQQEIGARTHPEAAQELHVNFYFKKLDFVRAVDDNGGLLMTPRRHVLAELDPHNHAVATLKALLLPEAVQSCLEDENWQCGLYQGEQCKILRPTPFEIWEPLIHTGTTSYQDNKLSLIHI